MNSFYHYKMYLHGKNYVDLMLFASAAALNKIMLYMYEHNRTFDLVIFACVVFGINLYYASKLSQILCCDLLFRQPGKLNIQSSLTEKLWKWPYENHRTTVCHTYGVYF